MFTNIYKYLQEFPNADGLYINWCNGYNRYNSCRRHLRSTNIVDIPKMDSTGILYMEIGFPNISLCSVIEIYFSY